MLGNIALIITGTALIGSIIMFIILKIIDVKHKKNNRKDGNKDEK